MLTEQGMLLPLIARDAISSVLGVPYKATPMVVDESTPWLAQHGACFVTLTQFGQLRGCIGTLEARRSLLSDVESNAVSAALHDPRFVPLTPEEFTLVRVEVSLLTTPKPLCFGSEKDALAQLHSASSGVVFEYGQYCSTFLPQVWESLRQPQLFLAELKRKAGLPDDFWAEGVKLSCYTVTKWRETSLVEEC
jgi:hypothetical protein